VESQKEAAVKRPLEVNDWLLPEELAVEGKTVLVLFHRSERVPALDAFAQAAAQHGGSARFLRINVDENPSVRETYGVRSMPALVLFVGGKESARLSGAIGDAAISELLARKP
jgi:thioredoxin-like negative regulator of GroEL